jgi:acetyltransferase-like isoleucine patch superfamily enzyme
MNALYQSYAYVFNKSNKYFYRLLDTLTTVLARFHFKLYNIQLGKGCRFYGFPKITTREGGSMTIGNNCRFRSRSTSNLIGINHRCLIATLSPSARIVIGNDCGFSGTVVSAEKYVKIGNNVLCGANSIIIDTDYHSNDGRSGRPKAITIEDNVWLGVNCLVMKGVHIGQNSVIGANSVVTKDIPANVIAAGNPCRVLRSIKA